MAFGNFFDMARVALLALQDPSRVAQVAAAAGLPTPPTGAPNADLGQVVAGVPPITGAPTNAAAQTPQPTGQPAVQPAGQPGKTEQDRLLEVLAAIQQPGAPQLPSAPTAAAPPQGRGGPGAGNVIAALSPPKAPQLQSLGALIAGLR